MDENVPFFHYCNGCIKTSTGTFVTHSRYCKDTFDDVYCNLPNFNSKYNCFRWCIQSAKFPARHAALCKWSNRYDRENINSALTATLIFDLFQEYYPMSHSRNCQSLFGRPFSELFQQSLQPIRFS